MKKTLAILSALVALIACSKEAPVVEEPTQKEKQEIKVNITISRTEMDAETKANIKSDWANDDVVYVFFSEAIAPAYLEMKYNSSTGWTATPKNELNLATLDGTGTMWAVYLPYGSEYKVIADGTSYTIKSKATDGEDYSGHFFYCEPQDYTISGSTLSGKISLNVASPVTDGDVLVHFDVTNATDGSEYLMYQEYLKPMSLSSISAAGIINKAVGALGDAIPGYKDASFVSFSGVLDKNYKGKNSYWFSIRDTELGTLYYRDAGSHAISANKYIGLGKLTGDGKTWSEATPGTFTVDASTNKKVTIARSNLAYRGTQTNKWQLMKYPWSTMEANGNVSYAENKDCSLFGWGTSGWSEGGWTYYQPWSMGYNPSDNKEGYGPAWDGSTTQSLTGDNINGDWGYYNTSGGKYIYQYGGETALSNTWRTPLMSEWRNMIAGSGMGAANPRTVPLYRYVKATVNGIGGLIIFPDGLSALPAGVTVVKPDQVGTVEDPIFDSNVFTPLLWNKLEAAGAVFLPLAGIRTGSSPMPTVYKVTSVGENGWYWSTTANTGNGNVHYLGIINKDVGYAINVGRCMGRSVRLVRDLN